MKLHGCVILALISNRINSPKGGGSRQGAETWSDARQLPGGSAGRGRAELGAGNQSENKRLDVMQRAVCQRVCVMLSKTGV